MDTRTCRTRSRNWLGATHALTAQSILNPHRQKNTPLSSRTSSVIQTGHVTPSLAPALPSASQAVVRLPCSFTTVSHDAGGDTGRSVSTAPQGPAPTQQDAAQTKPNAATLIKHVPERRSVYLTWARAGTASASARAASIAASSEIITSERAL